MTTIDGTITMRAAVSGDAAALADLGERTFRDAFASDNRPDDVEVYVRSTYSVERQEVDLGDPARHTLVAETGGRLQAYAQLRLGTPPPCVTGPGPVELLRFYVDRPWHGRGLAQSLMSATLSLAAELGTTLWLGVWERNARAIVFYTRCGFHDVGSKGFLLGADLQIDRIMVRPLR